MQIYLVGGAVRDELLDIKAIEHDWVVVGSCESEMLAKGYKKVGKDFPVFLHPQTGEEYALARTERKSGQGYHGFEVDTQGITLEEDLSRRDLTVNAIAKNIENSELIDPFNGKIDLENKVLRHVSKAFSEDPLRVLRVARFYARFYYLGFTVADETKTLMEKIARSGELNALTPERVWQETARALMEQNPEQYFALLLETNALSILFPELEQQLNNSHITIFNSLKLAQENTASLEQRFALLSFSSDFDGLSERIRAPQNCYKLAKLLNEFAEPLMQPTLVAMQLHHCFKNTQAYKNPAGFEALLESIMIISQTLNRSVNTMAIRSALDKASAIESKTFIEQGFSGAELGKQIEHARIDAIASQISPLRKNNDH